MGFISKIKDILFRIKDYDRLEHDYSSVLDYATGGLLSKTNYELDGVYKQGMILHEDPYESEHWDALADPEHKDDLAWAYQKDLLPVTTLNRTSSV